MLRTFCVWSTLVLVTLLAVVWLPVEAVGAGVSYWLREWKYVIQTWKYMWS